MCAILDSPRPGALKSDETFELIPGSPRCQETVIVRRIERRSREHILWVNQGKRFSPILPGEDSCGKKRLRVTFSVGTPANRCLSVSVNFTRPTPERHPIQQQFLSAGSWVALSIKDEAERLRKGPTFGGHFFLHAHSSGRTSPSLRLLPTPDGRHDVHT